MEQKNLQFTSTARYCQQGELNDATSHVWIVIHGYGQLAPYFIRKFKALDNAITCVIAPEGLSRFYLEGYTGRVGATWMTKEDRLTDIDNYINYLDAIYTKVSKDTSPTTKITVVGFSQGAATASRWIAQSDKKIDRLLLWAGIFPPDMDNLSAKGRFQSIEVVNVLGNNDPFFDEGKEREQKEIILQLGIATPKKVLFEGGHEINSAVLEQLA